MDQTSDIYSDLYLRGAAMGLKRMYVQEWAPGTTLSSDTIFRAYEQLLKTNKDMGKDPPLDSPTLDKVLIVMVVSPERK